MWYLIFFETRTFKSWDFFLVSFFVLFVSLFVFAYILTEQLVVQISELSRI